MTVAEWIKQFLRRDLIVGSTPTSVTDTSIAWSNGKDAWVTTRKLMVRFHPRSLAQYWSVSVSVARVRGKDEDRVQFPDGPLLKTWAARPTGRCLACNQEIGVRLPDGVLK